jgi:hypothetical protein
MTDLVWGLDVSTKRIAFASTLGGYSASVEIPEAAAGGERLAVARRAIRDFAPEFAGSHPPLCVWLEAPTGRFLKPTLIHMVGVTMEAVYSSLESLYPFPVSLFDVGVSQWKLASVGKGTADKAEVMAWAKTVGSPANQDEADALGIAYGGLALMGSQGAATA